MPLDTAELAALNRIKELTTRKPESIQQPMALLMLPVAPRVQSLADRGYIKISKVRIVLSGAETGEMCATLTEAGEVALTAAQPQGSA